MPLLMEGESERLQASARHSQTGRDGAEWSHIFYHDYYYLIVSHHGFMSILMGKLNLRREAISIWPQW